jgi:RHS repeat-associated protein
MSDNGTVVWAATYESFGSATITTATITNNLRFPGQYFDSESGLQYNWHRYYDPESGRYTAEDPIGFAGGDFNLYAYVNGDPINWYDEYGLWGIKLSYYIGYGGNISFGRHNGKWYLRGGAGVGLGGGLSFLPSGGIPICDPCDMDGPSGFIGASAFAGGGFGPLSAGWSGHSGLVVCRGKDGRLHAQPTEDGGPYAALGFRKGRPGFHLGGALNLVDAGIRF